MYFYIPGQKMKYMKVKTNTGTLIENMNKCTFIHLGFLWGVLNDLDYMKLKFAKLTLNSSTCTIFIPTCIQQKYLQKEFQRIAFI